jgi:hypothetical protein
MKEIRPRLVSRLWIARPVIAYETYGAGVEILIRRRLVIELRVKIL